MTAAARLGQASADAPAGSRPGRVLVAKLGLDGHDVGAKVVARLLRDHGFEVVYMGIRQSAETVARAAIDEDVDLIGVSILSGAHVPLTERLLRLLPGESDRPPVVVGGVIPVEDHDRLRNLGVRAVFTAGAGVDAMITTIVALASDYRKRKLSC